MSKITVEIIKSFLGLSVFKRPFIFWYFGEIAIGAPIFFPRKWKKDGTAKYFKWLGINLVKLGWKSKWNEFDIRFEWNPALHIIILKRQIVIGLRQESDYWEALVLYTLLKGNLQERVNKVLEKKSFKWTLSNGSIIDTKKCIFKKSYLNELY